MTALIPFILVGFGLWWLLQPKSDSHISKETLDYYDRKRRQKGETP